jgi:hypothetical protein
MPPDIRAKHIKNEKWVKSLRKTSNPEELASLIKDRIDNPNIVGPYINGNSDERPTDIINMMMVEYEGFYKKLTPAIGLLLYNVNIKKIKEDHNLIRGIFHMIAVSKLHECNTLVLEWINAKFTDENGLLLSFIPPKMSKQEKIVYRDALTALAAIQDRNNEWIAWWMSFWKSISKDFWYGTAIYGLRKQSPELAAKEIELLIHRNPENLNNMLLNMWKDEKFKVFFATELTDALNKNKEWAGKIVNMLWDKLFDDEKRENLLFTLKNN